MRQFGVVFVSVCIAACGQRNNTATHSTGLSADEAAFQKRLQEQFLDAQPGTVIEIPAGRHALDRVLTLRANGVTIRGAGADKSILSFKNEISGPEGLLVYGNDFTIENLAIEDSKGDGLKINDGENIIIRGVRVAWTGGPQTTNGAYGIYPVRSRNVLIENSASYGASDAGIYVGQSLNVIVRHCLAEQNVAGIEIENTINADVYDNEAKGNTGGILVFNMPNLSQPGHSTRVFRNRVYANNLGNYTASDGIDLSGQPTGVPLWAAAGGLDYLWRGVASGDVDFTLQHAYLGAFRCNADSPAQGACLSIPAFRTGEATNRTDARLAWTSHGLVPVTVAVYSNNLFDNRYVTGVQTISAATLGTPFTNITAPRFYGVEVGARL